MTGNKFHKDKLFAKISHAAASGVVGDAEYEVLGEIKLSVATTFATSGTLTVQGRIKHSSSWQTIGTLTSGGDFDTFDIDAYDFIRFNFTVAAGSTGEIAASGFFKAAAGGGATNTFATIQTDAGTNPVADSATDTLTLTSSDASITITGNSTTDTVDLVVAGAGGDVSGPASSVDNAIARFDGTGGKTIQDYTSDAPTIGDTGIITTRNGSNSISDMAINLDSSGKAGISTNGLGTNLYLYNNNALAWSFGTTSVAPQLQMRTINGSTSTPAYSFVGMTNGGIYRDSGSNELRMSIENDDKQSWGETQVTVFEPLKLAQYTTAGLPTASSFEGCIVYDTDTNTIKWSNGTSWATI